MELITRRSRPRNDDTPQDDWSLWAFFWRGGLFTFDSTMPAYEMLNRLRECIFSNDIGDGSRDHDIIYVFEYDKLAFEFHFYAATGNERTFTQITHGGNVPPVKHKFIND